MAERTAEKAAGQATGKANAHMHVPEPPAPLVPDGALLVLLVFDGLLLGAFGLMFTPLYTNGIPVPMGAILSILLLPWLVRQAGELDARPAVAGAPVTAWVVAVAVLGLLGPGGDAMLLPDWQSLLLLFGGIGTGLWALRAAMEQEYRERPRRACEPAGAERRRSGTDRAPGRPASRRREAEADEGRRPGG